MMNANQIKQMAQNDNVSMALVFKEQVQVVVLDYLFSKGLFTKMVFQGGTALRLAYQGVRYSEDLDFVLSKNHRDDFKNLGDQIYPLAAHVKKRLPMVSGARLKAQEASDTFLRYCLIIESDFLSANDKTNIEIANVPSYDPQTVMIRHAALALSPAVVVESPPEILSDKIVAVAARPYLKGRDVWDIYFLMKTLNVPLSSEVIAMARHKMSDYQLDRQDFSRRMGQQISHLKQDGARILREEMDRFLPESYRGIYAPQYPDICAFACGVLERYLEAADV